MLWFDRRVKTQGFFLHETGRSGIGEGAARAVWWRQIKLGGSNWVMVSMKRRAVVIAAVAWSAEIDATVGPMP